jgi:hypothetical protein
LQLSRDESRLTRRALISKAPSATQSCGSVTVKLEKRRIKEVVQASARQHETTEACQNPQTIASHTTTSKKEKSDRRRVEMKHITGKGQQRNLPSIPPGSRPRTAP